MSERPRRNPKPIQRIENEQARNAEAAAARAAARPKRRRTAEPNTAVPKRRKTPSNVKVNPKSKLLNTLAKLRNEEAPSNGLNRYGYTFLASLYRNHPAEQLKKYAFNWSNDKQIEFMKKQHRTLVKNTSRLHAPSETVNIPMSDEKMHDLLVMLWMDMSHDKLFNGSLNTFLTSSIKNEITTKEIRPKTTGLVNKLLQFKILKISNGAIVLMSDIERKQKKFMHEIWGDPSYPPKIVKKTAAILSVVKNRSKPIYVSYDAENADYITELLAKSRMNDGTYYLKRIFTVANLMDPGRGASTNVGGYGRAGGSVNKLINRLFDERNTSTPFKFNYQMFKFNFGDYFTIEIVPDGSKFNAKLNGKMLNMQVKRAEALNGNALNRISKTFGDFIQIITVAHMRKSGINIVSSTQDGGFVGMTGYVQSILFGIEPALISDSATVIGTGNRTETGIKFYGLQNYLRYNVEPERSGVTTRVNKNNNNNNNVSSKNQSVKTNTNNNAVTKNNQKRNNTPNLRKTQFIKILNKFTNLSQRSKRGYIQNFNNGTNANKLLREAKNENNKLKIAAASIRRGSLRKPNPEG
tara:strand:+ start:456 stop:2195 length:1740 start_codon:yes stop_codon:yes gene_type:complete